ncbi:hypothetical protein GF323_00695 [Candidatus Woesearchaeota archaeon]|nr:hypothetical protein [Candidatus Woesearchaeota archaeon]
MIDKDFLDYIEDAYNKYKQYKKKDKAQKFTFQEFLSIIMVWKLEEILERLEDSKK